jgi:hypothetical protein
MNLIKSGEIGTLRKVNIWANFNYGLGAKLVDDGAVPSGVDYDFWLGPAPKRPFNTARFHGSWRHFWDYGGGLMSDWGVHLIDMALWAGDITEGPKTVMTYAGNLSKQKMARETFDTMNVIYPKNDFVINYDLTAGIQQGPYNTAYGLQFMAKRECWWPTAANIIFIPNGMAKRKPRKRKRFLLKKVMNRTASMLIISSPASKRAKHLRARLKLEGQPLCMFTLPIFRPAWGSLCWSGTMRPAALLTVKKQTN